MDRAGFKQWRDLVELLFPPGSVAIQPDGHIRGAGLLSLDGAGEVALREAVREPHTPSRTACQIPVRLEAWAGRRRA